MESSPQTNSMTLTIGFVGAALAFIGILTVIMCGLRKRPPKRCPGTGRIVEDYELTQIGNETRGVCILLSFIHELRCT